MDLFLEKILTTDKVICDNIEKKEALGIELLSQNIVAQLRNFVEAIARFLCRQEKEIADNQKGTQMAISYIKSKEKKYLKSYRICHANDRNSLLS